MNTNEFLTFSDTRSFLTALPSIPTGFVTAYCQRSSYIEAHFEGIILVSRRSLDSELRLPTFSFVPHEYQRRLIKRTKHHFLGQPFRTFGGLVLWGHRYATSSNATKAERCKRDCDWQSEEEITVDAQLLVSYCEHHCLVPLSVADSFRFSERALSEIDVPDGRRDYSDSNYSYFIQSGNNQKQSNRPRMVSYSLLCGKRLLFEASSNVTESA